MLYFLFSPGAIEQIFYNVALTKINSFINQQIPLKWQLCPGQKTLENFGSQMMISLSYFLLPLGDLMYFQKRTQIQYRNRRHVTARLVFTANYFLPFLRHFDPIVSYLILFPWYNPMFPRHGQAEKPQLWKKGRDQCRSSHLVGGTEPA